QRRRRENDHGDDEQPPLRSKPDFWHGWMLCKNKAEGGKQKAESRKQKAEGRRQKAEGRRQKAESRRQKDSSWEPFCLLTSAFCLLLSALGYAVARFVCPNSSCHLIFEVQLSLFQRLLFHLFLDGHLRLGG